MSEISHDNKRIARNTLMLYIRMVLIMLVSLYTSRVTLKALGATDFGVFNVVGGVVTLLAFFTSSLSNATQRFLCIGLGNGDKHATAKAFRQSFTLMLLFSAGILLAGETVGLWFVRHRLVIPEERMQAAFWVYQCALLSVVAGINSVTFIADIISRERMGIYAWLGMFEALARLGIAGALMVADTDLLILYGALTALVSLITLGFYAAYCMRKFEETQCRLAWDGKLVREMAGFVGYNLFGCLAYSGGIQGTNIVLNLFFGPVVNAARGIAMQVTAVLNRLTDGVMTAIKPPIIKSYIEGDVEYMFRLIENGSKYMFFLAAVIAFPAMFEMELVLRLWLGEVPAHTVAYARAALCEQLLWVFIPPLWIAANATGDIRNNQVHGRLITLSVLPVSYVMLCIYPNPNFPVYLMCVAQAGYWIYCVYDIHRQLGMNIRRYFRRVAVAPLLLSVVLLGYGWAVTVWLPEDSLTRLTVMLPGMIVAGAVTVWGLLEEYERAYVRKFVDKRLVNK